MAVDGRIRVSLAASHDDYVSCLLIRSAVYVGEEGRKLGDEIDGNDPAGAHMIAHVDGEPAGTMRIRYFAGFAVLERMAILKPYRRGRFGARGVAWELGEHAFSFCREKGYERFYGSARDGLVDFWRRFAPEGATFEPIPGAGYRNGGMTGHPMEGHAPPLPGAVTELADHVLLNGRESAIDRRTAMRRAGGMRA
jgi:GNAT superfamily N-acetyltransferase